MAPGELSHAIGKLSCNDENVLIDLNSSDDASVYKIDEHTAIVQTVDIITPVVDDPFYYGQIAAANSLSDIFAMGGKALTALNIVGFDACNQTPDVLQEILRGGESKIKECGGSIVGGHTIKTPEMLYGLSVMGRVDPDRIYHNNKPRVGDLLVLTKPLGMGILTTAIKADKLDKQKIMNVVNILAQLNYKASVAMQDFDVSACTDITGFGLMGHAMEMADNRVTLKFNHHAIPVMEEAKTFAAQGVIPGGSKSNQKYLEERVVFQTQKDILLFDAQTSGGLLIAVAEKDADALVERLKNEGYGYSAIVAEVCQKEALPIVVT
ncbi:selenide, water dikinase SelD [Sulfurovum indicum]|uniref:Selenide, water dikinase n=1 Tax=Sulfurovum indicum TaxID=2779528 RepID=A0A7M1S2K4_9BACT|nr:selenide, water dikinase SelD [Sulfurovum indicum]